MTFGLALIIEGTFCRFTVPPVHRMKFRLFKGGFNLGFMFLPKYRAWVVFASLVVCLCDLVRDREDTHRRIPSCGHREPEMVQAFGINVPLLVTLTYAAGVALAGLRVLAAPVYQVNPLMGSNLIIVVFAVVVIGGMGSIMGSIVTGPALGLIEGLTKVFYPEASTTVVFIIMAIVLMFARRLVPEGKVGQSRTAIFYVAMLALALAAPFVGYPLFLMKLLCFALFACAFNLLIGFTGLLSFGHAMFLVGAAAYAAAHSAKVGMEPGSRGALRHAVFGRDRCHRGRWQCDARVFISR